MRVPVSPHPYHHLLLFIFAITASLVGVKQCLIAVFIFISLAMSDGEYPFVSPEKYFAYFQTELSFPDLL